MKESLLNPPKKDNTAIWLNMPSRPDVEARVFPASAVKALLADKNSGWAICEPEFVAKKPVKPYDEGKTNTAMRNANTEMTGRQYEEFVSQTVNDLKEYAKENEVNLQGCTTKKSILEKLEKEGKLL